MHLVLVVGSPDPTAAVRDALGARHRLQEHRDLAEALDECRHREVSVVVLVWPEVGLTVGRLLRILDRGVLPCPLLAIVPPELVAERRVLSHSGIRYVPIPVDEQELLVLIEQFDAGRGRSRTWLADVCIDHDLREVVRAGARVKLTRKEFDLLDHFQRNRGIVLSKEQLLDALWGSQVYNPNVVEVAVSGLRRKLEQQGPRVIHTVHGIGYVCHQENDDAPLHGLMQRRRSLLEDRQRLLAQRDAIVARSQTLRDGGGQANDPDSPEGVP